MSYDYLTEVKNINNSSNFCLKLRATENSDGTIFAFETLGDVDFDINKGFTTEGQINLNLKDANGKILKSFKTNNFNNTGFRFSFNKSDIPNIGYDSDSSSVWSSSKALLQNVNHNKQIRGIYSTYFRDIDFLYEKFLFPYLEDIFEKYSNPEVLKNKENLIDFLNEYNLSSEISLFAKDLVDIYNQAYFNCLPEIQKNMENTEKNSSEFRFGLCTQNKFFTEQLENRKHLFETMVGNKCLEKSNVREDKSKSLLDYIEENEKFLQGISDELIYRTNMKVMYKNFSDDRLKKKYTKECRDYCESFNKNKLISEAEKTRIKELESKIFRGASENEKKEYEDLIGKIGERYESYLKGFLRQSKNISNVGYDESASRFNRLGDGTKGLIDYTGTSNAYTVDSLSNYIIEGQSDWDEFLKLKRNDINAVTINEQTTKAEKALSRYAKNDNDLGVNQIDFDKLSIIQKIDSLNSFTDEDTKISQIDSLISYNIPTLENIVYSTEIFSGIKNNFWSRIQEDDKQRIFENQHYHYLSDLEKLKLFKEIYSIRESSLDEKNLKDIREFFLGDEEDDRWLTKEQYDNYSKFIKGGKEGSSNKEFLDFLSLIENNIENNPDVVLDRISSIVGGPIGNKDLALQVLRRQCGTYVDNKETIFKENISEVEQYLACKRVLEEMKKEIPIELKDIDRIHTHIKFRNKYEDNGIAFGFNFEDITTDGKIDLLKTLEQLKKLTDKRESLNKGSVEASNVSENINYIKSNILKGIVETNEIKASEIDLIAYEALCDFRKLELEGIKNKQKEIDSINSQIKEKQEKIWDLEDRKFFKAKKQIEQLNEEIKDLEEQKEKLSKEKSEEVSSVQKKLDDLSKKLKLSLEDNTLGKEDILTEEEKKEISNSKQSNIESLKANLYPSLENIVNTLNAVYEGNEEPENIKGKMMVLLSSIKDFPEEKIVNGLNEVNNNKNYLSFLLSETFEKLEENDKKAIIESVNKFYQKLNDEGAVSKQSLEEIVNSYLIERENLLPLDIRASNDLYSYLLNNKDSYRLTIDDGFSNILVFDEKETFVLNQFLNSKEVSFEQFLENNENLKLLEKILKDEKNSEEFVENLKEKIEELGQYIKGGSCSISIEMTEDAERFIKGVIQQYGDSHHTLLLLQGEAMTFASSQLISINASNNEMDLSDLQLKLIKNSKLEEKLNDKFGVKESEEIKEVINDDLDKILNLRELNTNTDFVNALKDLISETEVSKKDELKTLINTFICKDKNIELFKSLILDKDNLQTEFGEKSCEILDALSDSLKEEVSKMNEESAKKMEDKQQKETLTDKMKEALEEKGSKTFSEFVEKTKPLIEQDLKLEKEEKENELNEQNKEHVSGKHLFNKGREILAKGLKNVAEFIAPEDSLKEHKTEKEQSQVDKVEDESLDRDKTKDEGIGLD